MEHLQIKMKLKQTVTNPKRKAKQKNLVKNNWVFTEASEVGFGILQDYPIVE